MSESQIKIERTQNLWASFARSLEPMARSITVQADPDQTFDGIGGLAGAKDEILTYAYAAIQPEIYSNWGTFPPSGLLLIGASGCGKRMLGEALACQTETAFVHIDVPRLAVDMVHSGGKAGEFIQKWRPILEETPPLTLFLDELEFSQTHDLGERRADLPVGPIMDFLLELIDAAIEVGHHRVVGSTAHPDTLRQAFARPGRLERFVEVTPTFPDDVITALEIHTRLAESRAGRPLFSDIDWKSTLGQTEQGGIGDWVRVLHAVLRKKARLEAAGETPSLVTQADVSQEIVRFNQARRRIHQTGSGNYV